MFAKRAVQALAATVALALSAPAHAHQQSEPNCPRAASQQRLESLENKLETLGDRLDGLNDRLDQLADERREALDDAKDRIETVVHDESLSRGEIDHEVARALSAAQAKGAATARSYQALQHSMQDVRGQMEMLRQQMKALAAHHVDSLDDAG